MPYRIDAILVAGRLDHTRGHHAVTCAFLRSLAYGTLGSTICCSMLAGCSVQALKLDYLDLYLIHWPVTGNVGPEVKPSIKETWQVSCGAVGCRIVGGGRAWQQAAWFCAIWSEDGHQKDLGVGGRGVGLEGRVGGGAACKLLHAAHCTARADASTRKHQPNRAC